MFADTKARLSCCSPACGRREQHVRVGARRCRFRPEAVFSCRHKPPWPDLHNLRRSGASASRHFRPPSRSRRGLDPCARHDRGRDMDVGDQHAPHPPVRETRLRRDRAGTQRRDDDGSAHEGPRGNMIHGLHWGTRIEESVAHGCLRASESGGAAADVFEAEDGSGLDRDPASVAA